MIKELRDWKARWLSTYHRMVQVNSSWQGGSCCWAVGGVCKDTETQLYCVCLTAQRVCGRAAVVKKN